MVNQGTLLGRVGRIETTTISSGTKFTKLSMVTSKKFTKNGEKQEKVTWHNVNMYAKLAEIAEKFVQVGDLLWIQGEMDNQKYVGKDGLERTKSFVIAHELKLIPNAKDYKAPASTEEFGTDIPF